MNKKIFLLILLIFVSLIPLQDLLKPGAYQAHDFLEHAARLASFYESLKQGNLIPRWGGNLNYGYGHPVLMFLYPLTNYLGSIIHFLGFNIVDSIKIIFGISYILSGFFMFWWINNLWGQKAGFLAALFYLFAPYRFVDLYVRAALGEHLALTFVPLCGFAFTLLMKNFHKKFLILSGISLALLILSHNAISLMFLPFILLYCGYYIWFVNKKNKVKITFYIFYSFLLGFFLSAFFWVPAFLEGKYTLREIVITREVFINNYIDWKELFNSQWGWGFSALKGQKSGFSVQIGIMQWLIFLISFLLLFAKKTKERFLLFILILYFLIGAFFATNLSSAIVKYIPLIYRFQFPWRLLVVPVFISSLLAGYLIFITKAKYRTILLFILGASVILANVKFWHIKGIDKIYKDDYWLNIYTGTTETGESTPKWTIRFQEAKPPAPVQLAWGGLDSVEIKKWSFTQHNYQVVTRQDSQIVDNTLYFPGWKVYVDNQEVPIKFQDMNWRGIITFPVLKGEHQVKVIFEETRLRKIADLITLLGMAMIVILSFSRYGYKKGISISKKQ